MANIKACYIFDGQAYIEICLSDITVEGIRVKEYPERCFLNFSGYLVEVPPEVQKEFFKDKDRKLYIKRRYKCEVQLIPIEEIVIDEYHGHDVLPDPTDYEESCIDKIMGEAALRLARELPPDDFDLIESICMNGMSEYEYARKTGIPRMTVRSRKERILKKLKKSL